MRHALHIVLTLLAAIIVVACGDDGDVDRAYTHYRYDIVTYDGHDTAGDRYVLVGRDDEPAVTLRSSQSLVAEDTRPGTRVMLRYEPLDDNAAERRITAYAATAIISDTLRAGRRNSGDWMQHPMRLRSLWRTGDYLNLHCQLEYTGQSRRFSLVADSATLNADTVHCYILHNPLTTTLLQWRECYASYYIGGLWHRRSCRVMRVHVVDEVAPTVTHYDFVKN